MKKDWREIAHKMFNGRLVNKLKNNKYYWHLRFTEYFIEFNYLEDMNKCEKYLNKHYKLWSYDGIMIFNTKNPQNLDEFLKQFYIGKELKWFNILVRYDEICSPFEWIRSHIIQAEDIEDAFIKLQDGLDRSDYTILSVQEVDEHIVKAIKDENKRRKNE